MTNADYIRQMDDEKMFHFLNSFKEGDIDYAKTFCDLCEDAAKRNGESTDCDGCLNEKILPPEDTVAIVEAWAREHPEERSEDDA